MSDFKDRRFPTDLILLGSVALASLRRNFEVPNAARPLSRNAPVFERHVILAALSNPPDFCAQNPMRS
jgi:hypothetical protein